MPPKQKQAKKGPAYKPSAAAKDIVPADVKEPPREGRPLKAVEVPAQQPKNHQPGPALFEEWPSQQQIKAHDFGVASDKKFIDPYHDELAKSLDPTHEHPLEWRHLTDEPAKQHAEHPHPEIVVIETYLRVESEEEMHQRIKNQQEKAEKAGKDKKKGKKEQNPKAEGPLQVSDVKMNDVLIDSHMLAAAIWVGSQLQVIKQRALADVYTAQPIWKKIFPQENTVPVLSKSGKYWVKLLYMGKHVKVEIDDRVPVDPHLRLLLPTSGQPHEKWTLILCKAVLKYLCKLGQHEVVGNGLVAYCLTGMISENVQLGPKFSNWLLVENYLSNHHYQHRDIVITCFSHQKANENLEAVQQKHRDKLKSMKIIANQRHEEDSLDEGEENQHKAEGKRELDEPRESDAQSDPEFEIESNETQVIDSCSYCIGDYFDSQTFNMVFSQEKSHKEIMLRHHYNELCKVSLTNKTRDEKLEFRKKKKQLKEKLSVEEKKRLELITRPPTQHHFLKLLTPSALPCQYSAAEILLAKKCVANHLAQPPNYDIPSEREEKDSKSMQSISAIKFKDQPKEPRELPKEEPENAQPALDDFSSLPHVVELLPRPDAGSWLQDQDFLAVFEWVQVLYNPNVFRSNRIEQTPSKKPNTFTCDQAKEVLVVERVEDKPQNDRVHLLFGFCWQPSKWDTLCTPYCMLQKFDFDSFQTTNNLVTLTQALSSRLLDLHNINNVFKVHPFAKGTIAYWIATDSPFKFLSISDYLSEYEGYKLKPLTLEYPAVEANSYYPLAKIRLKQEHNSNVLLVKLPNLKDELQQCLTIKLVQLIEDQPSTAETHEGIIKKTHELTYMAYEYTRLVLHPDATYILVVEAYSRDNLQEGSLEISILAKQEGLTAEAIEQVEPVRFVEKYMPNKYGLIYNERLFMNADNNFSLSTKLVEGEELQAVAGDKKAVKKGGKEESPATEVVEKPMTAQRHIILRILDGTRVLYEANGVNQINLANVFLKSNKGSNREYFAELKFDTRVWPGCVSKNEHTDRLFWVVQLSSQETVVLVRDTKQEDKEKLTRKSWQDAEPGRAELAKKARRRFLLATKKEKGQKLTEEEQEILNAPRLSKKQMLEEEKKAEQKKNAKGAKKDDKKAGKDAKKDEPAEQKPVQRAQPKSVDNFMTEIKEFLHVLQNCHVRQLPLAADHQPRIRSSEELKAIEQSARMAQENRIGKLIRSIERRETTKIKQKQRKEEIEIYYTEAKGHTKEALNAYLEWRTADQEKDKARVEREKALIDLLSLEKPTANEADIKKIIREYLETPGHNPELAELVDMIRKNVRILALTDKVSAHLAAWEVQELKAINQQIKRDRIEGIDHQVSRQMKEMLEQSERNPSLAAEKQAEAKKGKKGGKK